MRRLGCSTKILIPFVIIVFVLLIIGLIVGPLGATLFKIQPPEFLSVSKPHVILPSEAIFNLSFFTITNTLIASWLSIIVLGVLFYFCTRKMKLIPGRLQGFAEFIVEALLNFIKGVAGNHNARRLLPVVATIFLYVLTNAYLALLPFFGTIGFYEHGHTFVPILRAANTDINLPLSIAIVSFIFVEYLGIKSMGALHYINGFFNTGELAGGIRSLFKGKAKSAVKGIMLGLINIFIGILEVFSHFIRIISFTFRLFGNMTAGEILLLVVTFLVPFVVTSVFFGLELFFGFIQALIFAG
ncbi:MAG TPA: F0F1 ATP synthase subunit A, partial [Dehalococcoidia bacterium]|nr:F0F1 ATP synthase subunit A [Dehalococcoidia bacterium]